MLTAITTGIAITMLFVAVATRGSAGYQLLAEYVVSASALVVAWRLARTEQPVWGAGFVAIAVLFNPFMPMALPPTVVVWVDVVCLATFVISWVVLKERTPTLSMSRLRYSLDKNTSGQRHALRIPREDSHD